MGPKLRATITRPDISGILSSLPTVTETSSSLTTTTSNSDDPIDELDAIIDDEDINMTFHDPLDDLFDDDQMLEVINPNLKIPRAKIDSEPTGFFSVSCLVIKSTIFYFCFSFSFSIDIKKMLVIFIW
jgi:hypothetical protein